MIKAGNLRPLAALGHRVSRHRVPIGILEPRQVLAVHPCNATTKVGRHEIQSALELD